MRLWHSAVSVAYLRAYLERAADAVFVPRSREELSVLLDAFVLEKALYEVAYEVNNRPDWVAIPIGGILELLGVQG
jgi:maltose alpha-D-glucosyltransferase/alpha-amylase